MKKDACETSSVIVEGSMTPPCVARARNVAGNESAGSAGRAKK